MAVLNSIGFIAKLTVVQIRGCPATTQLQPDQSAPPGAPPEKDRRQFFRDRRAAKPRPMHITASVLLSRPPLLVPDLHPFEAQVQRYQAMIEQHYYTDFPINFHFKRGSIGEKRWKLEHPMKAKKSASGIIRPLKGSGEPEWILGGNSDQRVIKSRRVAEAKRRERERAEEAVRRDAEATKLAAEAARKEEETNKPRQEAEKDAIIAQEQKQGETEKELQAGKLRVAKEEAKEGEAEEQGEAAQQQKEAEEMTKEVEAAKQESPNEETNEVEKLEKVENNPTEPRRPAIEKKEKGAKKAKRNSDELTDDDKRDLEQYAQEEMIEGAIRDLPPEVNADLHRLEREPQRTLYCLVKRSRGYHEWSGKKERRWQLIGMGAQSETGPDGLHVV